MKSSQLELFTKLMLKLTLSLCQLKRFIRDIQVLNSL